MGLVTYLITFQQYYVTQEKILLDSDFLVKRVQQDLFRLTAYYISKPTDICLSVGR